MFLNDCYEKYCWAASRHPLSLVLATSRAIRHVLKMNLRNNAATQYQLTGISPRRLGMIYFLMPHPGSQDEFLFHKYKSFRAVVITGETYSVYAKHGRQPVARAAQARQFCQVDPLSDEFMRRGLIFSNFAFGLFRDALVIKYAESTQAH